MDRWLRGASLAFAILGLLVSAYMTVFKLTDDQRMCLGSGDCSVVNSSIYSEVYGVPVAVIGALGYAGIAGALFLEHRSPFFEKNGVMIVFGLVLIAFLFTLYLIYAEIALIRAFCPFCIASQISTTVLFILSVIRLVREPRY